MANKIEQWYKLNALYNSIMEGPGVNPLNEPGRSISRKMEAIFRQLRRDQQESIMMDMDFRDAIAYYNEVGMTKEVRA